MMSSSTLLLQQLSCVERKMVGTKEKLELFMKLFIYGLSPVDGILADMTASIGITLHNSQLLYLFYFIFLSRALFLMIL